MSGAPLPADVEQRIAQWRGYVADRGAVTAADADELEDHLRERIGELESAGLDADEAFLIAIRRLGAVDALSAEYAREHSDRLWKQLTFAPAEAVGGAWRTAAAAVIVGALAGLAFKLALAVAGFAHDSAPTPEAAAALLRTLSLYAAPFVAGYLAWRRRLSWPWVAGLAAGFSALLGIGLWGAYPPVGQLTGLAALHLPVAAWALVGVAHTGGRIGSADRRMDVVRFTGEFVVYLTLLALGGVVLVSLTHAVLWPIGVDPNPVTVDWVLPVCIPGATLVAAWLVETKQSVIENIAPVLARVFTPLTLLMLLALLVALSVAGALTDVDRTLLILMDVILILVVGLTLYEVSARDAASRLVWFDAVQLATVLAAIAVDVILLVAMAMRTAEYGFSANKTAALGLNLLLLAHLAGHVWHTARAFAGRRRLTHLARWHTAFLPAYPAWAVAVLLAFPALFPGA